MNNIFKLALSKNEHIKSLRFYKLIFIIFNLFMLLLFESCFNRDSSSKNDHLSIVNIHAQLFSINVETVVDENKNIDEIISMNHGPDAHLYIYNKLTNITNDTIFLNLKNIEMNFKSFDRSITIIKPAYLPHQGQVKDTLYPVLKNKTVYFYIFNTMNLYDAPLLTEDNLKKIVNTFNKTFKMNITYYERKTSKLSKSNILLKIENFKSGVNTCQGYITIPQENRNEIHSSDSL